MTVTDTSAEPTVDAAGAAREAPSAATAKKRRSNVLPALILALALIACAVLLRPAGGGAEEAEEEPAPVPGEVVELEPMTLNLDDGHYLRLAVALELIEGVPAAEFEESGEISRFKDFMISETGGTNAAVLATPEGRVALKEQLHAGAEHLYPDEFSEVYLTELVVQ